jgi:hypothetical protein
MSRWCDRCGSDITFVRKDKGWIPIDASLNSSNYGLDHRKVCKADYIYIRKRRKLENAPIQIGEDEFVY